MEFEWDPNKAKRNIRKHRVSFAEAATVFEDSLATCFQDPDHSIAERRYLVIGTSSKQRLITLLSPIAEEELE